MTVREIKVIDDPVLRRKAKKIDKITPETRKLIEDMIDTMRAAPGVGLAAPQVGSSERVIVVEYAEQDEKEETAPAAPPKMKKLYAVINPEIVWTTDEIIEGTEGCLSIPGWTGDVLRHEAIVVKGLNRSGQRIKIKADNWLARIFQHEIDHLDGILYIDRLIAPDRFRRLTQGDAETAAEKAAEAMG
ncbi:MAG TPA: peptide deformylase [Anaerolineae bacterium]|jgi:peptide deformylase|nr:peptide deformylase [Anaerolineae bacterium]